LISACATQQ